MLLTAAGLADPVLVHGLHQVEVGEGHKVPVEPLGGGSAVPGRAAHGPA